ncbi:hypothetical protein [Natronococcus wangiae]|uniref:hypothetical protein n=1 Tax=Natronococcus wangiae TaxID=3068275 RepID=UPI00273F6185|nr:hypothetical protein [Natronococcus sp. AD5]
MVEPIAIAYVTAVTVLFFFWVYGIVSFVLDLKNKIVPAAVRYVRGRRKQKEKREREREREERERQLH